MGFGFTNGKILIYLTISSTFLGRCTCLSPVYSKELETALRTSLFTNYEVLQRPSELVNVSIGLNLVTVNSLDIKDQVLSSSGFFTMTWEDKTLEWATNTDYSNIKFLFSNEESMWRPAIMVENRPGRILDLIGQIKHNISPFDICSPMKTQCGARLYLLKIDTGSPVSSGNIFSKIYEYHKQRWGDDRLDWSGVPKYTTKIRYLFSNEKYMWRPPIYIENSVEALEVFSDTNWLIRIKSSGQAFWTPGGIFQTACDVDITYYPLDTQTCSIVLTTWAYTSNEISLRFANTAVTLDNYSPNGEWDLIETSSYSETATKNPLDTNQYSRLYFTLKLKRRPLFHILNTILPVLLMASLIVFVFKLPPESGERVGMSLTVLLAYAVYLTLIADNIPKTSLSTSILSTYLTIILMLSTLSVIFTIVVLDIYFNHADDEEPPSWVQTLTRVVLVKVSFWKGERCCSKIRIKPSESLSKENSVSTATDIKIPLDELGLDHNAKTRFRGAKHLDGIAVNRDDDDDSENGIKLYSWKEVALILDRCFMYLFIFLTIVVTVVCLGILASQ